MSRAPAFCVLLLLLAGAARAEPGDAASVQRGAYLFTAAGCATCHTDTPDGGAWLAGARRLDTFFGTFYTPNITPDRRYGIGNWSDSDFVKAMREGVSPRGANYYPAFPYTVYTMMTERDLLDLRAYLAVQPPVAQPNKPDRPRFPWSLRPLLIGWKILYFREGPFAGNRQRTVEWNRGAYLVEGVIGCGQCHTPRNSLGALEKRRRLSGVAHGVDGLPVPDITPDGAALGRWSTEDIAALLKDGVTPNGDMVGHAMSDVVRATAQLTDADRDAIAVYLKSLRPLPPP